MTKTSILNKNTNSLTEISSNVKETSWALLWWIFSGILTICTFTYVSIVENKRFSDQFIAWDSTFYREIAHDGYLDHLPLEDGKISSNKNAFFPVYPYTVRFIDNIFPGGNMTAFLIVNAVCTLLTFLIIHQISKELLSKNKQKFPLVLLSVFPSAFVFLWMYPESMSVLLISLGVLALCKERLLFSSIFFALATATRPNAVFFALVIPIFLIVKNLKSPSFNLKNILEIIFYWLISASGFILFMLYMDTKTNLSGSWFKIQREGWGESTKPFKELIATLRNPLNGTLALRDVVILLSLAFYIFLTWILFRYMKQEKFSAFSCAISMPCFIVFLFALSNGIAVASLRFAIIAVPIFIATPKVLSKNKLIALSIVSGICLPVLCALHLAPYITAAP